MKKEERVVPMESSESASINQKYDKSGMITREVRKEIESRDWRRRPYLEICEFVEDEIKRRGGELAFPVNICADQSAAHYTAEIDDGKIVAENALLKVDFGTHIDGYITDTSITLCYNDALLDMTEATRAALNEAIKAATVGTKTGDIGKIVEEYASRRGYLPIENLTGHALEQYVIHAGTSIPNVWATSNSLFKQDKVYAIEPFFTTTDGEGVVTESTNRNIFSLVSRKRTKSAKLDSFLTLIWDTRRTLPFAARWFTRAYSKNELDSMISELLKMRLIHAYPELVESSGAPVAQAEHTIRVTETGPVVLT